MTFWQPTGLPGHLKTAINTHGDPAAAFERHAGTLPGYRFDVAHDDGCPCVEASADIDGCTCDTLALFAREAA